MTAAKALGGGLPVGAVVTSRSLGDTFEPGDHGTTFGGGPVAGVAALAALEVLSDEALLANVNEAGDRFMEGLNALAPVVDVRGKGLMVGVTLADGLDAPEVRDLCLQGGLVVNCPGPGMLRFLPPLIVDVGAVADALEILEKSLAGASHH